MPCVFCESAGPMSNEHVWPQWIRRLLPEDMQQENVTYVITGSDRGEIRRTFQLFELKVKDVCGACNEGWMHRLEDGVNPIMSGMLLGRGRALHKDGQTAIATWATLKAFMAQRTITDEDPLGELPIEDYRALYGFKTQPLPRSRVFTGRVGHTEGKANPGFYHRNSVALTPPNEPIPRDQIDGYMLTFSVLDVMVQIFRPYGHDGDFFHGPSLAPSVRQIWPCLGSFEWPPGPALTQAGLQAIAGPAT